MYIPIYNEAIFPGFLHSIKVLLMSVHNSIRLFIIDGDYDVILEHLVNVNERTASIYSAFAAIIFMFAPALTFSFVLSFFKNISAYGHYFFGFFKDGYIFSELNEKSLALAESLLNENSKKRLIVFTNVFQDDKGNIHELVERANELGAICFKKDIASINFKIHNKKKSTLSFFTIGADESENINQSLKLINNYKERENTNLYVFSNSVNSELLLMSPDKGAVKVRRIDDIRSLINRILYDSGEMFFESAQTISGKDEKLISVVILGLGQYGTCMIKALSWFCQMDGYKVCINAFDQDPEAKSKFAAQCPELMSAEHNGKEIPGDAYYDIKIHSGINYETSKFTKKIQELSNATYVLVSLGNDETNIKTAVYIRMLFERMNHKPIIQAIVYNSDRKEALKGIRNYHGELYNIDFIGDLKSTYSEKVIINSELEKDALDWNGNWWEEEDFWRYEYNYRSSVASALHKKVRKYSANQNNKELLKKLEHRRWNAYMRSEGYCYAPNRNDLAKTHNCLVPFDKLKGEDRHKDDDPS